MAREKIFREHYESIHQLLETINSRPHNKGMENANSSHTNGYDFTKTHSFEEAIQLFENGYTDILDKVKKGVSAELTKVTPTQRRLVTTGVQGYAPHVPNAILGLPNSMIHTQALPQKTKTVKIVYSITENCGTDKEEFIKSGITVLSMINTLELQGYRVNLDIAFYTANNGNEYACGTVNVKDYREHMDIQKLCFPIAHPSMFRRIGFNWLETVPNLEDESWSYGYGRTVEWNNMPESVKSDGAYYLGLQHTRRKNYDVNELIKSLDIK